MAITWTKDKCSLVKRGEYVSVTISEKSGGTLTGRTYTAEAHIKSGNIEKEIKRQLKQVILADRKKRTNETSEADKINFAGFEAYVNKK